MTQYVVQYHQRPKCSLFSLGLLWTSSLLERSLSTQPPSRTNFSAKERMVDRKLILWYWLWELRVWFSYFKTLQWIVLCIITSFFYWKSSQLIFFHQAISLLRLQLPWNTTGTGMCSPPKSRYLILMLRPVLRLAWLTAFPEENLLRLRSQTRTCHSCLWLAEPSESSPTKLNIYLKWFTYLTYHLQVLIVLLITGFRPWLRAWCRFRC